uniref:Uncharacterized protein n=1 Tax=Leersia perrieri TaxID=77586 RepID=A0A0D9V931_9ORYZ
MTVARHGGSGGGAASAAASPAWTTSMASLAAVTIAASTAVAAARAATSLALLARWWRRASRIRQAARRRRRETPGCARRSDETLQRSIKSIHGSENITQCIVMMVAEIHPNLEAPLSLSSPRWTVASPPAAVDPPQAPHRATDRRGDRTSGASFHRFPELAGRRKSEYENGPRSSAARLFGQWSLQCFGLEEG